MGATLFHQLAQLFWTFKQVDNWCELMRMDLAAAFTRLSSQPESQSWAANEHHISAHAYIFSSLIRKFDNFFLFLNIHLITSSHDMLQITGALTRNSPLILLLRVIWKTREHPLLHIVIPLHSAIGCGRMTWPYLHTNKVGCVFNSIQ